MNLVNLNSRLFFGNNKKEKQQEANQAEEPAETKAGEKKATKQEEAKEPEKAQEEQPEAKNEETPEEKKSESSSDEEIELTAEDIKKIKALIKDQDTTIEKHEVKIEELDK